MQPQFKQVPPARSFSTQATLLPELRRADRADVAGRSAADDDEIVFHKFVRLSRGWMREQFLETRIVPQRIPRRIELQNRTA